MTGKAALILIIGFTLIFLVMGYLWESVATRSVDNHVSYYSNTIARNIAVSGANIALNKVLRDSTWEWTFGEVEYENGTMEVLLEPLDADPIRILESIGKFNNATQKVRIKMERGQKITALYAWFNPAVVPNGMRPWISGDKVYGAVHSNKTLVVDGNPEFFGPVTSLMGVEDKHVPKISNPIFHAGHTEGISVQWDSSMKFPDQSALAAEGEGLGGLCNFSGENLWLNFEGDQVHYRIGASSAGDDISKYSAVQTMSLSAMAPTGVIYVDKANVYLSGRLEGHIRIVCEGAAGDGQGNVKLVGDMVYNTDPMIPNETGDGFTINPESVYDGDKMKDMMEIVASNSVIIATSEASGGKLNNLVEPNINIDASIFCVKGGLRVDNLSKLKESDFPNGTGSIYLQGAMTAGSEEWLARVENHGFDILVGYNRNVIFDSRLAKSPPMWFTYTYYYKISSWLE